MFDVRDGGAIESKRYGHFEFPPGQPRMFGFNDEAKSLLNIFGEPTMDVQAQLKRVCIAGFKSLVNTRLISSAAVSQANARIEEENDDDLQRERDWWASRSG